MAVALTRLELDAGALWREAIRCLSICSGSVSF
jgi:hypothetical protein